MCEVVEIRLPQRQSPATKPAVLIVDDQPEYLRSLGELLAAETHSLGAQDCQQALAVLAEHAVDLILLDVMLPGMDGFTLCERLKSNPATADIPVIFVSASVTGADEERGFAVGAVDYVHKPFRPALVRARVRTHLRLRQLTRELGQLAATDGLTGLANRRALDHRLANEHQRAQSCARPLSMLLIDLDHFKHCNDQYGHDAGDAVLRRVSQCLQQNVRADDFVARWGGEEFALLTPCSLSGALTLAERVRAAIAAMSSDYGQVTISIGVAELSVGEPAALLFQRADQALLAAKQAGRNQVAHYS